MNIWERSIAIKGDIEFRINHNRQNGNVPPTRVKKSRKGDEWGAKNVKPPQKLGRVNLKKERCPES